MTKELIIGMEIQKEYSQFCYLDEEKQDAVSVLLSGSEEARMVPNDLFYLAEDKSWHCGEEAQELYMTKSGSFFTDILSHLGDSKIMILDGKEYHYTDLFVILLQLQLQLCFSITPEDVKKLVITSEFADAVMAQAVRLFVKNFHMKEDSVELTGNVISTLFYVFQQGSGVWSNGVGMFHYDKEGLRYEHIGVKRYQRPMRITVSETVHFPFQQSEEQELYMPGLIASEEEKDACFAQIIKRVFAGRENHVSGVFLLGDGFDENWLKQSAEVLCRGRRVFVGQNLYAKGACYAAASGSAKISQDGSVYVEAPGIVHYDIGVKVMYQGKEQIAPIVLGEMEWFNTKGNVCIFLDDSNRIEIAMYHNGTKEMIQEMIDIKGLPKRPPRTTKLKISVRYLDDKRGEICIRDQGFGTMFPTTGKVYRKEFVLP